MPAPSPEKAERLRARWSSPEWTAAARAALLKHGHANGTPEYRAWRNMLTRCFWPKSRSFGRYGGRGISVCARWAASFEAFLADVGLRPSNDHSIDRISNDGNYEPGNVRWATSAEQRLNKAGTRWVVVGGERMPLKTACERAGLRYIVVWKRLKRGWPVDRAFEQEAREAQAACEAGR